MESSQPAVSPAEPAPPGFWCKQLKFRLPRRMNSALMATLATGFALELAYALTIVVQRPLLPLALNGFGLPLQWFRLVAIALFMFADLILLSLGTVYLGRYAYGPIEQDAHPPSKWVRRAVGLAVALPISTFVFLALSTHLKTEGTDLYLTKLLANAAIGVAFVMAILSLIATCRAPRILRRGVFRTGWPAIVGYLAAGAVLVGIPFAATLVDMPTQLSPIASGFAAIVRVPAPQISASSRSAVGTQHTASPWES